MLHDVPPLDGTSPKVRMCHGDRISMCCVIIFKVPCAPLIAEWNAACKTKNGM